MRILTLDTVPAQTWPYQSAAPGGGVEVRHFPLLRGTVDALPEGHAHWEEPLAVLHGGAQVLNVDSRAELLQRGG